MSYASLGANAIYNFFKNEHTLMLAEGLNIFRCRTPRHLIDKTLAQSKMRELTDCSVVAMDVDSVKTINPDQQMPIKENSELILIGSYEGERKFFAWENLE